MRKNKIYKRREVRVTTGCFFCQQVKEPDYKSLADLEKFTTDRGKILGRTKTGVCQKHQRRLGKAIKRARFLALMPFILRI